MAQMFTNNAFSALAASASNVTTSLTLTTGTGSRFPTLAGGNHFLLTLIGLDGNGSENAWEIVKVTARSNDVLTVVRGQEGTTAVAWNLGSRVELRVTAGTFDGFMRKDGDTFSGTLTMSALSASSIVFTDASKNLTTTGTAGITQGGTGKTTASAAFNALSPVTTLGDLIYGDGANSNARLAGNTTATKLFLTQTGTGTVSAAPAWGSLANGDLPLALSGKTYEGLTLTANATGFKIAGGTTAKTFVVTNNLTLSGTDASTLNIGSGGTLGSAAFTASTAYQPVDADLTAIAALTGTSGFLKTNGAGTWSVDTATYLTGNQSITISGDASGSGTTAITLTLATVPVSKGGTGATTLTGMLKGTGTTAITAATAGTDYVAPGTATSFTKPQRPSLSTETAPATNAITWDLTTNQILRINLNANITTFNLTGTLSSLAGNQYQVIVRYNGGTAITWNANIKWPGGTAPTLTGTSGKVDTFTFVVSSTDGTNYYLLNTGKTQNL